MCSCDFEANQTKIKGGCQSERKVVPHDSKSDLPPVDLRLHFDKAFISESDDVGWSQVDIVVSRGLALAHWHGTSIFIIT